MALLLLSFPCVSASVIAAELEFFFLIFLEILLPLAVGSNSNIE